MLRDLCLVHLFFLSLCKGKNSFCTPIKHKNGSRTVKIFEHLQLFLCQVQLKSTKILLKHYTPCLNIHEKVVWQHVDGGESTDLQIYTAIPFTINIFEKVFLAPDKADMDEKEESGQDKEDGEIGRKDENPSKMRKMVNYRLLLRPPSAYSQGKNAAVLLQYYWDRLQFLLKVQNNLFINFL